MSPYRAAFLSGMRRAISEPGELSVRMLFYAVILIVFSALWKAAVGAVGGPIEGYGYVALLWYVVAAEGAVIATKPRLIEDIGTDIASGAIAVEMLRPVSVVGFRIAAELGESFVRLGFATVVGGGLAIAFAGGPPNPAGLGLAVPSAVLAVACNLAAQHAFAAVAFWLEDAKSAWFLYQKLVFLVGGMLLPLEFLPGSLRAVAWVLPFWTTSYAPARLAAGHVEAELLLGQLLWLAALVGAAMAAFAAGERRLEVAGG
ncbi:MAG TPA: ABC-2 family transporter protein [Actinomycetota bacterium]|nr:ABC-2 family transporter protein [Actinomycetota bacterium]